MIDHPDPILRQLAAVAEPEVGTDGEQQAVRKPARKRAAAAPAKKPTT